MTEISPITTYTKADVAEKNGKNGSQVWIIYKDSVYDVTKYVDEHPGGEVLLEEAGKDATRAFEDVGHSSDAKKIMAGFKIGEIVEAERKYDANGKKRKIVVPQDQETNSKSCCSIITCGLIG